MGDFYEKNKGITYTTAISQLDTTKSLLVPYGGNGNQAGTSESISYYLTYLVDSFILTESQALLTSITQLLNTITELSSFDVADYNQVYFPIWEYNVNGNIQKLSSEGSAQDSNQVILQELIQLYSTNSTLLDTVSPDLLIITSTAMTTYFTSKGVSMPDKTVSMKENLKRIIQCMIINLTDGGYADNETNATGNFAMNYNNGVIDRVYFGLTCMNKTSTQSGGSVRSKELSDYVNYALYMYIDTIAPKLNITVDKTFTTMALGNHLTWIETAMTNRTYEDIYGDMDGFEVTFNRLSYQLTQCLLLYKYGDKNAGIIPGLATDSFYTEAMITQMKNIMEKMIEYEYDCDASSLKMDNSTVVYFLTNPGVKGENSTGGYARHMSYLLYMKMYGVTKRRSDGGGYLYLENSTPEKWFGIDNDDITNSFYKQATDWAAGNPTTLDFFANWNSNNTWAYNDKYYFNFVLTIIHFSNYHSYLNNI
jgi:hypothetical protein